MHVVLMTNQRREQALLNDLPKVDIIVTISAGA